MTSLPGRVKRTVLNGNKLVLRDKREGDAKRDYKWKTDPEIARLDASFPIDLSFSQFQALHMDQPPFFTDFGSRTFAIDTLEGEHIGNCMYYNLDKRERSAELGIIIGESAYWNQGYGTEALNLFVKHLFEEMRLGIVYLHTLEWNIRARRAFEKCGFSASGIVNKNGYVFAAMQLERSRWERMNSSQELWEAPACSSPPTTIETTPHSK